MGVKRWGMSVPIVGLALAIAYIFGTREHVWYRFTTSLKAIQELSVIPHEKLERFLKSYDMFEKETFVGDADEIPLLTDYYSVLIHLCSVGNFEKMYLPPVIDPTRDTYENQRLYEKQMADALEIGPNSNVLDIGCGRGRIAHHVAQYTGAKVTGINVDETQIQMAKDYAESWGMLGKQLDFKIANYNDPLPFPDAHFDALYYVQVLSYSTDLKAFFREVFRVVKPGGKVAFEDYIKGPNFDENNPHHHYLKSMYKPVLGGVETSSSDVFLAAVKGAGFNVLKHEDGSVGKHQYELIESEARFWLPLNFVVGKLAEWGLIPEIYGRVMSRMTAGTDALIEADRLGIVSCGQVTVAQKPF